MQALWGLIRALQMISLSGLIRVNIPNHLFIFLSICIQFAQMDIFDGQTLYEVYLILKETGPVNENFAFFGIENSNFILNSGSYFIILAGLVLYYATFWGINAVCVYFSYNTYARKVGIFVYEEDYRKELKNSTLKLFLESYYDLVICAFINFTAFYLVPSAEFGSFWSGRDNIVCSITTIVHAICIFVFPFYGHFLIKNFMKHTKTHHMDARKDEGNIKIFLEGVSIKDYHSSMYNIYFLGRRLLTGGILVILNEHPYFQCTSLMVFSAINIIYMVHKRPLDTKHENRVELLNEASIYLCA